MKPFTYPCLVICFATLFACQKNATSDPAFTKLSDEYMGVYLASNPQTAVSLGLHEYDGKLVIPTPDHIKTELAQLQHYDSLFAQFDSAKLSPDLKTDYTLLRASIQSGIYHIVELKGYENPMAYGPNLSAYIERNYAPAEQRLQAAVAVARQLPAYFAAARQNIGKNPAPELVGVAIEGLHGAADYMLTDVPKAFAGVKNDSLHRSLAEAMKLGADATNAFATHLAKNVLPNAHGTFAIGASNYRKMLRYNELLEADPDSLLAMGMAQLKREQAEFAAAAKVIDPTKTPAEVFKAIQREHPTADQLLPSTRNHCEAIRQFLLDKQIISVPSDVRATVTKTPDFMVGATAAMNPPGPFEKPAASEAYYYVTLPKKQWTGKQQEEWLTQFNRYVSEVVSIHEAYPGHYVQFLHLNASKVSKTRKMLASYAFVEGWAHYTEQMMLEQGYGGSDPKTAAKYKMAQLSESLLRYCRLVSSIQEHTNKWTVA